MTRFESEAEDVVGLYPKLDFIRSDGQSFLAGEIELFNSDGEILDLYQLEIHPSSQFPYEFPLVYEKGGKIPVNIEWHVYEDSGHCCIKILPEEELICKNGLSLKQFIAEQLIPYLFNQTFRRENGYYVNERPHGIDGLIDYYGEKLGTREKKEVAKLLGNILFKPEPDRVAVCFCGSGEKYRRCHRDSYRLLSRIKKDNLLLHLNLILKEN